MKLKDNFFKIKTFCKTENGIDYAIELNSEHSIFKAHFPNNPVMPGVCIIQTVKELSEEMFDAKLFLKKAVNIKFVNIINPVENRKVVFSIAVSSESNNERNISAVVKSGDNLFAKLSILFENQ
jgi:3-hydroxyacyl-[acyl-carrier-protein] dehydratase